MIQLNSVVKKYAGKPVFNPVSCQAEQGLLHIMGENGSGKTTLLNMMAGTLQPDEGQILYSAADLYAKNNGHIKHNIGYIPALAPVYPFLSGSDFLRFICKIKKSPWPSELIETLNLARHLNTNFASMSYGTKKKFLLVAGMIGAPRYLLLDEPMNGLDQQAVSEIYEILTTHLETNNGLCILVSHDLSWIDTWKERFSYCFLKINGV